MKVYVVIEAFLGEKVPEIKGVYKSREHAEKIKDNYRFSFIDEQNLIQFNEEKMQEDVYVIMELMVLNVPRIVGVLKNKAISEEMATNCEYDAQIMKMRLL